MRHFSDAYAALRRKNRGQYALLAGCSFFSVLLITAYVCMMRSPTILSVLPEGGDSRKQVMMVFVLAVIGCAVFTAYAAGLFFRQKSRETGVFLALGATRRQLQREMGKELAVISLGSCAAGAALGGPLAWGVWQLFRLFLVDSQEMALSFDPRSYLLSMVFAAYVVGMLFFLGGRSIRRTNIIDIVQESHKSEPIREVKRWYGSVGIVLVVIGALAGYLMPSFFVTVLQWYPPSGVEAVFYLPALVGMYMILLHTVVNGWRKRHKYRDIIATSMMKFQGRQTVRNMLVMTLLIVGAYFASFYAPMLNTSSTYSFSTRPVDFEYHWRNDQNWPERGEVESLASKHGVDITSWTQVDAATLGCDGTVSIEQSAGALGTTYTQEYREVQGGATYFSESAWNALTGQAVDLAPGTCANVLDDEGGASYLSGGDVTLVTNMVTGASLSVTPAEPLCFTMLLGCYVLDDADYEILTAGLTDLWRETWVFFNVADSEASYPFADALFNEIVDRSGNHAAKYDERKKKFGTEDVIPLWIADMDFKTAQPIIDALKARAEEGIWGYTARPDSYFEAIRGWQKRRNGWDIDQSLMSFSLGVVQTLSACVKLFTPEGGSVLIQTPVYSEFYDMTEAWNRKVLENQFVEKDGKWTVDWADFEEKLKQADLFLLCSPHNPLGHVWTEEELRRMMELCLKHHVLVVSDEIHSDLIFHGKKHIPTATLSPEIAANVITGISGTKTFNLAGLQASTVVFPNAHKKEVFDKFWMNMDIHRNNAFSLTAMEAAFNQGEEWLDQLLPYLSANFDYVVDYCEKRIPKIKTYAPDATYLMWLDCRELGMSNEALHDFMIRKAKLGLNDGCSFGRSLNGFMRLNAACPRATLEQAMRQLEAAVNSL